MNNVLINNGVCLLFLVLFMLACVNNTPKGQVVMYDNEDIIEHMDTTSNVQLPLLYCSVKIDIPTGMGCQKHNYEEGVIYMFSDSSGSHIIIFEGDMMEFPEDNYIPNEIIQHERGKTYRGVEDGLYWRKDVLGTLRCYYGHVSKKDNRLFERCLNSLRITENYRNANNQKDI